VRLIEPGEPDDAHCSGRSDRQRPQHGCRVGGRSGIHEQWPGGNWERIRQPSTAWEHGGPIIERARIDLIAGSPWRAVCGDEGDVDGPPTGLGEGPTPLVAAMRAYVASKFGEWIDLN